MDLPLIIMFASMLAACGGPAQQTVAELAERLENSAILPNLAVLTAGLTAFFMAYLGAWISSLTAGFPRALLVTVGLAMAAITLFRNEPLTPIREPTRSVGAIALALGAKQAVDAPRWLAFAGSAAIVQPLGIALGAVFGSAMALLLAWLAPQVARFDDVWRNLHKALAVAALIASIAVFLIGWAD